MTSRSAVGLVVKYLVAIEMPRVRFPDGAALCFLRFAILPPPYHTPFFDNIAHHHSTALRVSAPSSTRRHTPLPTTHGFFVVAPSEPPEGAGARAIAILDIPVSALPNSAEREEHHVMTPNNRTLSETVSCLQEINGGGENQRGEESNDPACRAE